MLWIDVWGEALRDANLRRISEELDHAWVDLVAEVITGGIATGAFRAATRSTRAGGSAPCSTDSAYRSSSTTARWRGRRSQARPPCRRP